MYVLIVFNRGSITQHWFSFFLHKHHWNACVFLFFFFFALWALRKLEKRLNMLKVGSNNLLDPTPILSLLDPTS